MLELSADPQVARQEMNALIFYLTTFSYIDGEFDPNEVAFIRGTIHKVIEGRIDSSGASADPAARQRLLAHFQTTFEEVLKAAQKEVIGLLGESIAEAEEREAFVTCKLKQRCFEIFRSLNPTIQRQLVSTVDGLLMADGHAHAAEVQFRDELFSLLNEAVKAPARAAASRVPQSPLVVREHPRRPHQAATHRFFDQLEQPLAADQRWRERQLAADRVLINAARETLEDQRVLGQGTLSGLDSVAQLGERPPGLDGYVYSQPLRPGEPVELTVLGDLHGCYSCLKAALVQSGFFNKVAAHLRDPRGCPHPKLVLLGDYLDRGLFGYEVLRLAMHLLVNAPDHVCLLRGNHEMFVEHEGEIHSVVRPAETIERLRALAPREHLVDLMHFLNALPSALLFGRVLLTHGGIPRDGLIKQHLREGLGGLNQADVRFQMMWSDPSAVDVIPKALQDATYRFGFGRLQARGFLERLGCHTLIRGHDQVASGFKCNFDDGQTKAFTLFSAGGGENSDLPEDSGYRDIRPMALTVTAADGLDGPLRADAWPIDWAPYTTPPYNGFYR